MLENVTSGRNSGISERLKWQQPLVRVSSRLILGALIPLLCILPCVAQGQSAGSSISAYADAIKQSTIAERIVAMERYLALSSGGGLKVDALEFLVWDHMRLGHQSQTAQRARELIAISPANPIALAALNQNAPSAP